MTTVYRKQKQACVRTQKCWNLSTDQICDPFMVKCLAFSSSGCTRDTTWLPRRRSGTGECVSKLVPHGHTFLSLVLLVKLPRIQSSKVSEF